MTQSPRRILITGYHGFVARFLAPACVRAYPEAQIFGMTHAASHLPIQGELYVAEGAVEVIEIAADIVDGTQVRQVIEESQPDLVFHLAAISSAAASWSAPAQVVRVNAVGFAHLVEAIRAAQLDPRIIVVGSSEQYGIVSPGQNPIKEETPFHPANPYAVSKAAQDQLAVVFHAAFGMDLIRARPFNHFGPGQRDDFVIAGFARQIALMELGHLEPVMRVGNLSAQRDFLPVSSVVEAYLALAKQGQAGEAYNIGSGTAHSIAEILGMLLEFAAITIETRVDPERFRPVDALMLCADSTKIQRDTTWRPDFELSSSLRATLDFWRAAYQTPPRYG